MSTLVIACPHCGLGSEFGPAMFGQVAGCPDCLGMFRIPKYPSDGIVGELVPAPPPLPKEYEGSFTIDTPEYEYLINPRSLTSLLRLFLKAAILLNVVHIVCNISWLDLLKSRYGYRHGTMENQVALINLCKLAVNGLGGLLYLRWISRANKNSRGFGAEDMEFSPAWAIGSYFVPILQLYKPYQSMKEIYQVSRDPENWRQVPAAFVGWWWGVAMLGIPLVLLSGRLMSLAVSPHDIRKALVFANVAMLVDMVHTGMTLSLIGSIAAMQEKLVWVSKLRRKSW